MNKICGKRFCPAKLVVYFALAISLYAPACFGQEKINNRKFFWASDSVIRAPRMNVAHFIAPALAITWGFIALGDNSLQDLDHNIQENIWEHHPQQKTKADNYLQWAPIIATYGLNIAGVHGEHDFLDLTALFAMSNIFLNLTVTSLKGVTHQLRPDSSDYYSFPSGHTAEAFANAEIMRLEFRNKSFLYGVAGYLAAAFTGYLRMYNNKHYLSDVLAGAGIGVLSTDLSYILYPKIKAMFVRHHVDNTVVMPFYDGQVAGFQLVHHIF